MLQQIFLYGSCGTRDDHGMSIHAGMKVQVTTASGEQVPMISVSDEVAGRDMPVVWVSAVDEYRVSRDAAHRMPWPSQYVRADEAEV